MSTSPQAVCRWWSERKSQLVLKLLRRGDATQLPGEYGLGQPELYTWRDGFLEGGRTAFDVILYDGDDGYAEGLQRTRGRFRRERLALIVAGLLLISGMFMPSAGLLLDQCDGKRTVQENELRYCS